MVNFADWLDPRLLAQPKHRASLASRAVLRGLEQMSLDRRARLFEGDARECNLCGSRLSRFLKWGDMADEFCPVCIAMGRHRIVWAVLDPWLAAREGRVRVLHVAPEPSIGGKLEQDPRTDYLSGDLDPARAMAVIDIEAIDRPDGAFDLIHCMHVLEHVSDPPRALAELRRCLAPDGLLVLGVPLKPGETIGDPTETNPGRRVARFGQADHFWYFGEDFETEFVRPAGFSCQRVGAADLPAGTDLARFGMRPESEPVFLCRPD